jgi:metal-responsive CopG/Arc/MetJ family transcriptional regulator
MKTKIGTVLEEELVQQLKERSVRDDRSISDILQDALRRYLHGASPQRDVRLAAVERFCSKPFQISAMEIEQLLTEEYYEQ